MSDYPIGTTICDLRAISVSPGISNVWYCNNPFNTMDTIFIPNPSAANTELVLIFDLNALKLDVLTLTFPTPANLFVAKYYTGAPTNVLNLKSSTDNPVASSAGTGGIFTYQISASFTTTSFNLISDGSFWIQQ